MESSKVAEAREQREWQPDDVRGSATPAGSAATREALPARQSGLRRRWRRASITTRVSCLIGVLVYLALAGVGMSLYDATRVALNKRADLQLIARIEHMRTLLRDLYTVQEIESRPALFETMMGNEQDVIVIRRPGTTPFINVNPQHTPLPALAPVRPSQPITLTALADGRSPDGWRMRWIAANAVIGNHGETIEIVAAHVMTQEERVLALYRQRVIATMLAALVATLTLVAWSLRRSLAPLRQMAARAADVTPENLAVRLDASAAPAELETFAASFNAMLDRLTAGYQRLLQFSADLAHELRTPIGVLIGQTQVLLVHPRSAADYRQVLESNLEELERLARIAENILFLARTDHERQGLPDNARTQMPLQPLLETIGAYFEGLAEERNLRFDIMATGTVSADALMCRRAINNVVVNAVRYATPGTCITLRGGEGRIVIGNQSEPIPNGELARLFDRFYRRDPSRTASTESNGLGLSIVHAIMRVHGGGVWIQCDVTGWITVTLDFHVNTPPTEPTVSPVA
ncbi:two-component system heavy metal sensor histidine kinase CusS [Robbsia andropogonis]|uniref:heavy metal sensor histidine kinase n=1 Tax=Robbsia andropogonis TaxID=28092 RepID=UPI003D1B0323